MAIDQVLARAMKYACEGRVSRAVRLCRVSLPKKLGFKKFTVMTAFPALEELLQQAERIRTGSANGTEIAMARDLAEASQKCVATTRRIYPTR